MSNENAYIAVDSPNSHQRVNEIINDSQQINHQSIEAFHPQKQPQMLNTHISADKFQTNQLSPGANQRNNNRMSGSQSKYLPLVSDQFLVGKSSI